MNGHVNVGSLSKSDPNVGIGLLGALASSSNFMTERVHETSLDEANKTRK
nr:7625_t:CDS:2 [Entrophospora candida]